MNWVLGVIILSFIVELVREREKLKFSIDWPNRKVVFAKGAKDAYFVLLLLGIIGVCAYLDNQSNSDTIKNLNNDVVSLSDSVKYLHGVNLSEQQRHEDNLKKYGERNTEYTASAIQETATALGVAFAKGTNTILGNAAKEAKALRDTIRVMKEAQLPNIGYDQASTKTVQSNDTFYLYPCFKNNTAATALNFSCTVYFIKAVNGKNMEYYKPLGEVKNFTVGGGEGYCFSTGGNYIPNYYFDSTNSTQFMLILGSYKKDDVKENITKDVVLAYKWDVINKEWQFSGDPQGIENAHYNKKSIVYFIDKDH